MLKTLEAPDLGPAEQCDERAKLLRIHEAARDRLCSYIESPTTHHDTVCSLIVACCEAYRSLIKHGENIDAQYAWMAYASAWLDRAEALRGHERTAALKEAAQAFFVLRECYQRTRLPLNEETFKKLKRRFADIASVGMD